MPFCGGLRTFKPWQKGPEIKSSETPSVCGRHQSHGQRPTDMAETRADSQHRAIFLSHFDQFREKQKQVQKARSVPHL